MSPMTSDALNLDLIKILGCPVILVTGSYLGALNHALTALGGAKGAQGRRESRDLKRKRGVHRTI